MHATCSDSMYWGTLGTTFEDYSGTSLVMSHQYMKATVSGSLVFLCNEL